MKAPLGALVGNTLNTGLVPGAALEEEAGGNAIAAAGEATDHANGQFSIVDWSGYPEGIPKPAGPFRLLEGDEYEAARDSANTANNVLRRQWGLAGKGVDIHEIQPVKFGGSPTDPANKIILDRGFHIQRVTPWWRALQRSLERH